MLNIRNSVIIIVLLATTLVNSALNPRQQPGFLHEPRRVVEGKIRMFEAHLEHYRSITEDTLNDTNHFNSWSHWNQTSYAFKRNCVIEYWNELNDAGMDEDSEKGELGRFAYKALDTEIKEAVAYYLGLLANHPALKEGMQSILDKGEYLKFEAFWTTAHGDTLDRIKRQLVTNDRHLTIQQANLIAILPGYLTRVA